MLSLYALIFCYLLGGLTFIPIVICLAYLALPSRSVSNPTCILDTDERDKSSDITSTSGKYPQGQETDVAAGYFAVCREYVPGGQNGKPPERTTPAGEVVGEESPSVYQSMYRSIFDRKQAPSIDPNKANGKTTKKANNTFYIVLRHHHLILFETIEQLEVRHVISLSHHDVSVYGEGGEIPEGELWIKRNAICLTRKPNTGDVTLTSKPFFLFSDNCSDKEDFYFALLRNQEQNIEDSSQLPKPLQHELKHIILLVQRLHSSDDHSQTRWINGLVGRLFLAMYKTKVLEDFIRMKITKKISRVKKPAFLGGITLEKLDMGETAPYITNPRLKDLTVDGDCCVEADIKYTGHFRLEIATTAKMDLGPRFKVREVNLVLAVVVKKLEGHILLRLKPPPSNRLWFTFEKMPSLDMTIEPIVSSRQITYSIILRAIESRIREVMAETLVYPHWDDIPFTNTLHQRFRGGIWSNDVSDFTDLATNSKSADQNMEDELEMESGVDSAHSIRDDKPMSTPTLVDGSITEADSRRTSRPSHTPASSLDTGSSAITQKERDVPKVIRSRSFASPATPVIGMENVNVDATKSEVKLKQHDATSSMIAISSRSQPTSSPATPIGSPKANPVDLPENKKQGSFTSSTSRDTSSLEQPSTYTSASNFSQSPISSSPASTGLRSRASRPTPEPEIHSATPDTPSGQNPPTFEKRQILPVIGATALAAKKWGLSVLNRNNEQKNGINGKLDPDRAGTPEHPIGRGRPLPPPGIPLPPPERRKSTPIVIPKRKPLPPPSLPGRRQEGTPPRSYAPPPLPERRHHNTTPDHHGGEEGLLVVAAPPEQEPLSPLEDGTADEQEEFVYQMKINPEDAEPLPIHSQETAVFEDKKSTAALDDDETANLNDAVGREQRINLPVSQSFQQEDLSLKDAWQEDPEQP